MHGAQWCEMPVPLGVREAGTLSGGLGRERGGITEGEEPAKRLAGGRTREGSDPRRSEQGGDRYPGPASRSLTADTSTTRSSGKGPVTMAPTAPRNDQQSHHRMAGAFPSHAGGCQLLRRAGHNAHRPHHSQATWRDRRCPLGKSGPIKKRPGEGLSDVTQQQQRRSRHRMGWWWRRRKWNRREVCNFASVAATCLQGGSTRGTML